MHVKLITEHDCAVECNISCSLVEMLIIKRALKMLSEGEKEFEGYRKIAEQMTVDGYIFERVEVADEPQTDCAWK